ncbi:hypothetical protein C6356_29410 [Bacillus wiedmannii]|nr:hypothetical protein C6356_29410 [Bacillus wiedmannii]
MGCSKSENMMFWNSVFIGIYSVPKGVPFGIGFNKLHSMFFINKINYTNKKESILINFPK